MIYVKEIQNFVKLGFSEMIYYKDTVCNYKIMLYERSSAFLIMEEIWPKTKTYAQQQTIKVYKNSNELLKILPSFCTEYFNSLEYSKQPGQGCLRNGYQGFFEFLICEYPQYANYAVKDFTLADLEKLKGQDISDYLRYVKLYDKEGKEVSNSERAAKRKLCALRRFLCVLLPL